jgi:hypothetical protein
MSDAKHTPGPWRLVDEARNGHYRDSEPGSYEQESQHCRVIETHDAATNFDLEGAPVFVADVVTSRSKEGDANARLIAAAPDLLEACKVALFAIDPQSEYGTKKSTLEEWASETCKVLKEAIVKAEGRTQ